MFMLQILLFGGFGLEVVIIGCNEGVVVVAKGSFAGWAFGLWSKSVDLVFFCNEVFGFVY